MIRICSFCGVDADKVRSMVAGPRAAICQPCAIRCMEIMRDYTAGELEYASWFDVAAIAKDSDK